jgi:hypothetical protein
MSNNQIVFSYDPETRIRTATYSGEIDTALLFDSYRKLISQPYFDGGAHDLADLRAVTKFTVSKEDLYAYSKMFTNGQPRPAQVSCLAIVAHTALTFGLSRMFEMMTESELPKETRVFSDYVEASAWLKSRPHFG